MEKNAMAHCFTKAQRKMLQHNIKQSCQCHGLKKMPWNNTQCNCQLHSKKKIPTQLPMLWHEETHCTMKSYKKAMP